MTTFRFRDDAAEREYDARNAFNAYWNARAVEVRAASSTLSSRSVSSATIVTARAALSSPVRASSDRKPSAKLCWMPKGVHEISAGTMSGEGWSGTVVCDEQSAQNVIASFAEMTRAGERVFIDFAHRACEAAGWIGGFSWDRAVGIVAGVDWTAAGASAIADQVFTSFSPTFYVEWETGRVAGLVPRTAAGGLVNTPAFGAAMPALTASATNGARELVRQAMLKLGRSETSIKLVAAAVELGYSAEDICTLIRELP